jgi:alpha-beta hydrolase superfamily lysophospholipase
MDMKQEFCFLSTDGDHSVHGLRWIPEGEVKAVLQIVHGMSEHIERYDEFGCFLAQRGVAVVGHSHLGHGLTARNEAELGWFGEPDGNELLIGDIHTVREMTRDQYPGVPYFILGHSMGSFLTRQYLGLHGEGLNGAVIMGTSDLPGALLGSAAVLCRLMAIFRGWQYRSPLIDSFIIRGYERKMGMEWLSKNEKSTNSYAEDPRCGFAFTLNGFYHFFRTVERVNGLEVAGQFPKDIPILFTAGSEDPVGSNGKCVATVYSRYKKQGANARIKLYPGDRHEILNELDRLAVFEDILAWMELA